MNKVIIILPTDSIIFTSWIKSKVEKKFTHVVFFFIDQHLYLSKKRMIHKINEIVNENKISTGFFQGDYLSLIDYDFISNIKLKNKYFYLTDDFDMHEINTHTAMACDGIVSCCPISVLRYEEKGLNAHFIFHESDERIFKNLNIKKDLDVLFFGSLKANRSEYINKLKDNNINCKVIGPANENGIMVSNEELNHFINRSKIVINFSSTGNKNKFYSHKTHPFNYLYPKGRIMIAGLCGTLCVSEYAPAHNIIFSKDTLIEFHNSTEMVKKIQNILIDDQELKSRTIKFEQECQFYSDSKYFNKIFDKMVSKSHLQKLSKFPFWYIRAFNLRSIRLYGKSKFLGSYIQNTVENISELLKFKNFFNFLIILENIIYLPFIIVKILSKKTGIEK